MAPRPTGPSPGSPDDGVRVGRRTAPAGGRGRGRFPRRSLAAAGLLVTLGSLAAGVAVPSAVRPADAATTVTFAAAGDFAANPSTTDWTVRGIGAARPAFALALGDLSYGQETPDTWCARVKAALNTGAGLPTTDTFGRTFPFQVMAGNHDAADVAAYKACLPDRMASTAGPAGYPRQYTFDSPAAAPLVRVVALGSVDSESYLAGGANLAWVARTIDDARTRKIPWVVVAVHENYLSVGRNTAQVPVAMMDLLLAKRVDVVLQAHDHNYQRSKQLVTRTGCTTLPTGPVQLGCVAADGTSGGYVKGRGTVVVVTGTGGMSPYPVSASDPEAGWFAAWRGSIYGFTSVQVTATSLTGSFVRTGGTAWTDRWSITSTASDTAAPSVPSRVHVPSVSAGTVSLTWRPSTDGVALDGYRVFRNGTLVATTAATSWSGAAPAGTTSVWTVAAVDRAGNASVASRTASVALPASVSTDATAPTRPGTPSAAASTGRVDLSWRAATDDVAVAGYQVERNGALVTTQAGRTWADTGRAAATSWTYRVRALDGAGRAGPWSSSVTVRTP